MPEEKSEMFGWESRSVRDLQGHELGVHMGRTKVRYAPTKCGIEAQAHNARSRPMSQNDDFGVLLSKLDAVSDWMAGASERLAALEERVLSQLAQAGGMPEPDPQDGHRRPVRAPPPSKSFRGTYLWNDANSAKACHASPQDTLSCREGGPPERSSTQRSACASLPESKQK